MSVIRMSGVKWRTRACRGMRHVDVHLAPILLGHEPAFGAVANDARHDQDDQLGLLDVVVAIGKYSA